MPMTFDTMFNIPYASYKFQKELNKKLNILIDRKK